MTTRWLGIFALIAALGLMTPTMTADGGRSKAKGNAHVKKSFDREHHEKRGDRDHRWEHRNGYEHRIFGHGDGFPPGWKHGKKTGWRHCGLPPGHAKKYDCRTYVYERRTYYYYRDDYDRIVVRRPTVHIHAGVDIVR